MAEREGTPVERGVRTPPPSWGDDTDGNTYLFDVVLWLLGTDLGPSKQASALVGAIKGAMKDQVRTIPIKDLCDGTPTDIAGIEGYERGPKGVVEILKKFQEAGKFVKREDVQIRHIDEFFSYKRLDSETVAQYLNRWDMLRSRAGEELSGIKDETLGKLLLAHARLSTERLESIKAAIGDFKVVTVRTKLIAVFRDDALLAGAEERARPAVKEEEAFVENEEEFERVWCAEEQCFAVRRWVGKKTPNRGGYRPGKCYRCGKEGHYQFECREPKPERQQAMHAQEEDDDEVFVSCAFVARDGDFVPQALMDSGCATTVCGRAWLAKFVDYVTRLTGHAPDIVEQRVPRKFVFGGGAPRETTTRVLLPVNVVGKNRKLAVFVLEDEQRELPLLLSIASMEKLKIKVDYGTGVTTIDGTQHRLPRGPQRQMYLPLVADYSSLGESEVRHLHVRFGHCSATRLKALLHLAGKTCPGGVIDAVVDACSACRKYRPRAPLPPVAMPHAHDFNDIVAVDVAEINGTKFVKIIDLFSRFGRCVVVPNKSSAEVAAAIEREWISLFGPMQVLACDAGSENVGAEFVRFCEGYGVELRAFAGKAQHANGAVERFGRTVKEAALKLLEDGHGVKDALRFAVFAYNALANDKGFAPAQVVFGAIPRLPGATSQPQAPELDHGPQFAFVKRLHGLQEGRRRFLEADAAMAVRRGLAARAGGTNVNEFQVGDKVWFFDPSQVGRGEWRGPGTVVGVDPNVHSVFVSLGNRLFTRHFTMVSRASDAPLPEVHEPQAEPEPEPDEQEGDIVSESGSEGSRGERLRGGLEAEQPAPAEPTEPARVGGSRIPKELTVAKSKGDYSSPRLLSAEELAAPRILRERTVLCALEEEERKLRVHMPTMVYFENSAPGTAVVKPDKFPRTFGDAKAAELANFVRHGVFVRVHKSELPRDANEIDTRWVCSWKTIPGLQVRKAKARLVARGFQERVDDEPVDSPTGGKEALRIAAQLAANHGWRICSVDVTAAFLQSEVRGEDERVIAIIPPPEAREEDGIRWVLQKSMYGLRSAPTAWWRTVSKSLVQDHGFSRCVFDEGTYVLRQHGTVCGVVVLHVDDFFCAGNDTLWTTMRQLKQRFNFGAEQWDKFVHVGVQFERHPDGSITMSQERFIRDLHEIPIPDRAPTDPLRPKETEALRSSVGSLLWVAGMTRADVAADVTALSTVLSQATVRDLVKANKLVRTLRASQEVRVTFRPLVGTLRLVVWADAAYQNLPLGRSLGGVLVVVAPDGPDAQTQGSPISWSSTRIKKVVTSTLEAEVMSQQRGFDSGTWLAQLWQEMSGDAVAVDMLTDCKSLTDSFKSIQIHLRSKRMRGIVHQLREALEEGTIRSWSHVSSSIMEADGLTRPGHTEAKQRIRRVLQGTIRLA